MAEIVNAAQQGETPAGGSNFPANLWTRTCLINNKPYHFDLRENVRGRYLKMTEQSDMGRRTIFFPVDEGVPKLQQAVSDAINQNYDMDAATPINAGNNDPSRPANMLLFSITFRVFGDKRFYLDLIKGDQRGLYLKLVELQPQRPRSVIVLPESGWAEVSRLLNELTTEMPAPTDNLTAELRSLSISPSENAQPGRKTLLSKSLAVPPKKFFFDLNENEMGRFCKVSEVQPGRRFTVIVPDEAWPIFVTQLELFISEDYESVVEGTTVLSEEGEDAAICSRSVPIGGRHFYMDMRKNARGTFLKLSEVKDNRRNTIFLPTTALTGFKQMLEECQGVPPTE